MTAELEKMENTPESASDEAMRGMSWQDRLPDPRAIVAGLRRNLWLMLLVFLAIVGAAAYWTFRQVPIYAASSTVLVRPQSENVVDIKAVSPDLSPTTDVVDTEVGLVRSPTVSARVADAYLARHPSSRPQTDQEKSDLAARLLGTVDVSRVGSTYIIRITSRATDGAMAAEIANLFAEQVVEANRDAKRNANTNASKWLNSRISELKRDAKTADAELQDYKVANKLGSANGATLAEQQISTLTQQIAAAQADRAEKQGRLRAAQTQLARGGGGADVGAALGSGTIGTLRAREAEMSAEVARLQAQYGEAYPPLETALAQLQDTRRQIQLEINRILSNLDADLRASTSRLASLQASRAQASLLLDSNNKASVGLTELQRQADAANGVSQTFLNRLSETSAQEGLQQADLSIAGLAARPLFPESPRTHLNLSFAAIGGLIAALFAAGIAEYVAGGVRSKSDVEKRLRVRYAGAIPSLASTLNGLRQTEPPHDFVLSHPLSMFAESFRSLRAFLLLGGGQEGATSRVLAIASPLPREGKTTVAICLARTSAAAGRSVVLVDCDLRRRGASEALGITEGPDLYSYLAGEAPLDACLRTDPESGLVYLGTTSTGRSASDPITSETMQRMLVELRSRFQVIIIDTAPVLGVADARVAAAAADRVLMITRWASTSIRACEAAIEMLLQSGVRLSGLALSQVDMRKYTATGYAEALGYGKKFKGYYTN